MRSEGAFSRDRIVQDPMIMVGEPVIMGSWIPVERVIAHLAHEPDLPGLFAAYPELTVEDVKAALEYAHGALVDRTGSLNGICQPQGPNTWIR